MTQSILEDIGDAVFGVAPTIATMLGGPMAGAAITAIGSAMGMKEASPQAIETQFRALTPDRQAEVLLEAERTKQAEWRTKAEIGKSLAKVALSDSRGSVFQRNARPSILWAVCFGGMLSFILGAIALGAELFFNSHGAMQSFSAMVAEFDAIFIALSAIAGFYVKKRSDDKLALQTNGSNGSAEGGFINGLLGRVGS